MKKLYECMPARERAWLARVAFLAAVLWLGVIAAVALAPSVGDSQTQSSSDRSSDVLDLP